LIAAVQDPQRKRIEDYYKSLKVVWKFLTLNSQIRYWSC